MNGHDNAVVFFKKTGDFRMSGQPGLSQIEILNKRMRTPGHLENIVIALDIEGGLNSALLFEAFLGVCRRQESLRFTFLTSTHGSFIRHITRDSDCRERIVDLRGEPPETQDITIARLIKEENFYPFDPVGSSLVRYLLIKAVRDRYVCVITLHHVVGDGWSRFVLMSDLAEIYNTLLANERQRLPVLNTTYADYVDWHRDRYIAGEFDGQKDYWAQELKGMRTGIELVSDRVRPKKFTFAGEKRLFSFGPLSSALTRYCKLRKVSEYSVMLAAFYLLIYGRTGCDDISVRSPIANRDHPDLEGLIGYFVHGVAVRAQIGKRMSGADLVRCLAGRAASAYQNHSLPAQAFAECCSVEIGQSFASAFSMSFNHHNYPRRRLKMDGCRAVHRIVPANGAKTDFQINTWPEPSGMVGSVIYYSDVYDGATVRSLISSYLNVLNRLVAEDHLTCAELSSSASANGAMA